MICKIFVLSIKEDVSIFVETLEAVLDRYDNNFLDRASVLQEYALFRNEQHLPEVDASDVPVTPCRFWCQLYKIGQYKELAKLAVLVMMLTPDTVECERGFSCMNYISRIKFDLISLQPISMQLLL